MADFVAVLRKTIGALGENTPQMRERVYEKARATIEAKLAAIDPPPPAVVIERQRQALEDAIAVVRAEHDAAAPEKDDELDRILDSLSGPGTATPPAAAAGPEPEAPAQAPGLPEASPAEERPAEKREDTPALAAAGGDGAADPGERIEPAPAPIEKEREAIAAAVAAKRKPAAARRRSRGGLVAVLALLLIVVAGGSYAVWINRDDFSSLLGLGPAAVVTPSDDVAAAREEAVETSEEPGAVEPEEETAEAGSEDEAASEQDIALLPPAVEEDTGQPAPAAEPEKFTERLLADGSEVDEGPAGGPRTIGEGTSVAAAAPPPPQADTDAEADARAEAATPDGAEAAPSAPAVAVGQRAIFYEERTSASEGSADTGSIVWSVVQESPGGNLPPEPAIRAEATIPGKDVQLRMTIRRNGDQTLPAAHIVEMIFLTPDGFEGGSIANVSRIAFKETEEASGNPLLGIPAKIADGFFLIALGDSPAEIETNTTLLRRQNWVDIPIAYQSGRRALLTMEKGIPGDRVFEEVLRAWTEASG